MLCSYSHKVLSMLRKTVYTTYLKISVTISFLINYLQIDILGEIVPAG